MNLLLAITMCLQDETAEDTYRRVEETLAKAKTLSIKYRIDLVAGPSKMSADGTVHLKEGNRLKITLTSVPGAPKQEASAASDGTTVRCHPPRPGATETEWAAPATLNEDITLALLRAGCYELHRVPLRMHHSDLKPKEQMTLSDFRKGEDDAGLRTVLFKVSEGSGGGEVKVWVDPKTWTLRRRVLSAEMAPGIKATVTENYEIFKLNGEIPNDAFALPAK